MDDSESDRHGAIAIAVIDSRHPQFAAAAEVRRRVFIEEQSVPEAEEWDADDNVATHLLATADGKAAGTLRFFSDDGWMHVGRVAVLPEYRSLGLGRLLMAKCLEEGTRLGFKRSFLNAQSDKTGFYAKFGYHTVGAEFLDAGIPHFRMELDM